MKLFYRKYGEGPPLIILHGLYGSSDNWVTIAKKLSDIFTVYLPDIRNHGQSPHSDMHDYDSMRDDLFELAGDLRLKKFFLAGHSMGGKAAIAFAARWPEMLDGLIVADISPFMNESTRPFAFNQHLSILKTILSIDLSAVHSRADAEKMLQEKISSEQIRSFIMKNLQRHAGDVFTWKLNAVSLYNNLDRITGSVDLGDAASHPITGFPVVFLKGSQSNYLTAADFIEIRRFFPAAELKVINGAGHWIHADRPDEVIDAIRSLLNE